MNRTRFVVLAGITALAFFAVCGGAGTSTYNWIVGDDEPVAENRVLIQNCSYPPGVTLSEFDPDGDLHWSNQAADGHLTVRYCDPNGNIYRTVEIAGAKPGESEHWQAGAATDGARRVINIKDLSGVIATVPTTVTRLNKAVTVQCLSLLASCEPAPAPAATPGS